MPPIAQQQDLVDGVPTIEDPRANPAFDEAYDIICVQTIRELDAMHAAADAPNLVAIVDAHHHALTQRIASVHNRADLWSAADPLVLEFAQTITDGLASIVEGSDIEYDHLDGDVTLFRALCGDWFTPV